ncbi:hypothetical protein AgCh_010670 [Apium graveolens]
MASREMKESFARFSLDDEEQEELNYAEDSKVLSEIDMRWCLVGKFLTNSSIDFQAMQHKLALLWRPGKDPSILKTSQSFLRLPSSTHHFKEEFGIWNGSEMEWMDVCCMMDLRLDLRLIWNGFEWFKILEIA